MCIDGRCVHCKCSAVLSMCKHGVAAASCSTPSNAADMCSAPANLQLVMGSASDMVCTNQHMIEITKIGHSEPLLE